MRRGKFPSLYLTLLILNFPVIREHTSFPTQMKKNETELAFQSASHKRTPFLLHLSWEAVLALQQGIPQGVTVTT